MLLEVRNSKVAQWRSFHGWLSVGIDVGGFGEDRVGRLSCLLVFRLDDGLARVVVMD